MKQSRNVRNYRLKEGNSVSGTLPPALDSFLQDIAQITGMIDYTDIMNFGARATAEDVKKLRKLYKAAQEAAEYDDEDDYNDIARDVRKVVVADEEYHHPNYGIDDCSCCGSNDSTDLLQNYLRKSGYDVEAACDILEMDPCEVVCKDCYDSFKLELDSKLYSEYNDLGIDTRTGEPFGESRKRNMKEGFYTDDERAARGLDPSAGGGICNHCKQDVAGGDYYDIDLDSTREMILEAMLKEFGCRNCYMGEYEAANWLGISDDELDDWIHEVYDYMSEDSDYLCRDCMYTEVTKAIKAWHEDNWDSEDDLDESYRRTEESAKKVKKSVNKKNLKEDRYLSTEAELDAIFNGGYEDWYDGIEPDPEKAKYIHKAAQDAGMSDLEYVNREEVLDQLDAENEFIYELESSDVSVEDLKIEAARTIFEGYKQEIEEKGSATGSYGHQMTDDYDLCEDILEGAELYINDFWISSSSSHSIEEMIAITAQYYNDPRCTKVKALYDALVEWASGFNALVEGYVTGFRTIDIVEPSGYVATETTDDLFDDDPDSFEDYETDEDSLYESKKLKEKFGVKGNYGIEVNAIAGKQYGFSTVDIKGKPNTDEEPFEAKTKEAVLASKMYAACVKRYGQDRVRVVKF